ncbi:MAG TPA: hypothetical protein VK449_00030 [Anaerolineales bacterium]|nr:hypothetical protein [Anaerolineales bacterium]
MNALRRFAQSTYGPIVTLLALLLVLAVLRLTDYGASLDEYANTYYGGLFLRAYAGRNLFRATGINYFNGPFYFMLFTITARLFHALHPAWSFTDGIHLTNFLTFLVGVFFFYRLALRLLPRGPALLATALFLTQPVLFGHGFINQKDTPLMAFFLASVELGWAASDRWRAKAAASGEAPAAASATLAQQWQRHNRLVRWLMAAAAILGLLLLFDLWVTHAFQRWVEALVETLYTGRGPAALVGAFRLIAQDAYKTPLDAYLVKLNRAFGWMRLVGPALAVILAVVVWRVAFPVSFSRSIARWLRRWGLVLVAGCVLGMATSIRALAPLAGLLVAGYWVGRDGRRALPAVAFYAGVALAVTYLTWPILWGNPFTAITGRVEEFSTFSSHFVLLLGQTFTSDSLPWFYVPLLLLVQLTLPALVLLILGIPGSWRSGGRLQAALLWFWFLAPLAAVMIGVLPIYNNFRHLLFALPPLFLVMGLGAQQFARWVRAPALRVALALLALVPGVVGIVRLHPYEYIYYNELVGGVRGANGRFDLDYWCTAFRAAMEYVNSVADPGDRVATAGGHLTASPFARKDISVDQIATRTSDADYALACRRDILRPDF